MIFIIEKSEETTLQFPQIFVNFKFLQIVNLLNDTDNENSKFATKKWYIIDSKTTGTYSPNDEIFLTNSLESRLSDDSDAYILVTGNINVTGGNTNTKVAFKNCVPFKECKTNK